MKLTVNCKALESSLSLLQKVLDKDSKTYTPILECVKIVQKEGLIKMTASDGSNWATIVTNATAYEGVGAFCVPLARLLNAIKSLGKQEIELIYNDEKLIATIRYANGRVKLKTQAAGQFPKAPKPNTDTAYSLEGKDFCAGIKRASIASSTEEVKAVMTGVYVERKGNKSIYTATDGRLLVTSSYVCSSELDVEVHYAFNMPKKVVNFVCAMGKCASVRVRQWTTSEDSKRVEMVIDNKLQLNFEEIGKFPSYERVIPQAELSFKANKADLLSAFTRLRSFCNQSSGLVNIKLDKDILTMKGSDDNLDMSITEKMYVKGYKGEPIIFGMSAIFTTLILKNIVNDEVDVFLISPDKPIIFKESKDNMNSTTLIMPMLAEDCFGEKKAESEETAIESEETAIESEETAIESEETAIESEETGDEVVELSEEDNDEQSEETEA